MTYQQILHQAMDQCATKGVYPQGAQLLLLELCREMGIDLYANFDREVKSELLNVFNNGLIKLLDHMPVAYILGYDYFYGYKLKVTPDVLIPRSETEELVMNTLQGIDDYFPGDSPLRLVDIGTGSGAIAIALALEEPRLAVTATDISTTALAVAKHNAIDLNAKVELIQSDMLQGIMQLPKFDVLVSNPPYIRNDAELESSVKDYEPSLALFGGLEGLDFYQTIMNNAPKILNQKALLTFEIGYDQKDALTKMAKECFPKANIEVRKDLNNKDRILMIWVK